MASINATNTNTSLVKEYRTLFDWRKKRCILHADVEASCTVHNCLFLWSSLVQQASIEASSGDRGFTVLRKFSWEPQGHRGLNRIWIWSESPSILGNSISSMQMNQCPKSAKTRWNANDKNAGCDVEISCCAIAAIIHCFTLFQPSNCCRIVCITFPNQKKHAKRNKKTKTNHALKVLYP